MRLDDFRPGSRVQAHRDEAQIKVERLIRFFKLITQLVPGLAGGLPFGQGRGGNGQRFPGPFIKGVDFYST